MGKQRLDEEFGFAWCCWHSYVLSGPGQCRRTHRELRRSSYVDGSTIAWHGMQPYAADWSDESRLVAWTLADGRGGGIYIAFNSSHRPTTLELPHWHGRSWQLVSDTGKVRWLAQRAAPLARRLNCTHVL